MPSPIPPTPVHQELERTHDTCGSNIQTEDTKEKEETNKQKEKEHSITMYCLVFECALSRGTPPTSEKKTHTQKHTHSLCLLRHPNCPPLPALPFLAPPIICFCMQRFSTSFISFAFFSRWKRKTETKY
eukprot:Hpha_TRINITY_DN15563_c0_g3::TRINITY_DN15563_c0_g3_i1::g.104084::m.104084